MGHLMDEEEGAEGDPWDYLPRLAAAVSFSDDAKKPLEHMCAPHPHKELPRSPYR